MDETLEIGRTAARIDRLAFERELHDVVLLDAVRRARARQEEALRIVGMPRADVTEGVHHPFRGQDAVGGDEFFEEGVELGHAGSFLVIRHPEVRAERASKDDRATDPEPSPFEGRASRGRLRVTVRD